MRILIDRLRASEIADKTLRALRTGKSAAMVLGVAGIAQLVASGAAVGQETRFDGLERRAVVNEHRGMHVLDYSRIRLSNGADFDMLGIHYFVQANDWLYAGVGAFAPMVGGNAGGFFGAAGTLHAQRQVFGNWFVNGGISLGAGAGGSSIPNIPVLSGDGLYSRVYAGIGYNTGALSFGVNYSRIAILNSQINDSTLTFFVQRPFTFSSGSYADAGAIIRGRDFNPPEHDTMLSVELATMQQINPTGSYTGDIGLVTTQYSHFHSRNFFTFFGVNMGHSGLSWYNQAQGGIGYRFSLGRNVNVYSQLGIGSGGWVTSAINTGPGIIVYPRVALEYLWDNGIGLQASAGYLYAPRGTSRNWTFGLGLNYHLSHGSRDDGAQPDGGDYVMHGVRLSLFGRRTSDIFYRGSTSGPLSLIALQADYALNDHWYLAGQLAVAGNTFRGYAGYAEAFAGLGYQTNLSRSGRLQGYAQLMVGLNDLGITAAKENGPMLYPAIGVSYALNDRLSLYSQIGATHSIGQYISNGPTTDFENYSVGLGVTYRFSLPTRR